ncbi:MAG: efflux RND transporter periplasmic adaptor subunit, partial [Dehalococcoidales bacterium]|nr:efflux RND transporter periplasmic adaptor subunit [Dehalococcoidales bacterium]
MKSIASGRAATKPWPRRLRVSRPLIVLVILLLAIAGYYAYDRFLKPQPAPAPTAQPVAVSRGSLVASVSATGSVIPATTADLAFDTSGRLTELAVSVGQAVKKGDVLAKLDTTALSLAVTQAQAQLASAEAKLASLQAGSTSSDIAQAQAQLKSAQASLDKLKAGPTPAQLQAAQASVASAKTQLQKAQSDLADLQTGPTQDQLTSAQIAIERAKITLQNAQAAYDKISWRPDVGSTKEAMDLWQATTDYAAAKVAYDDAVAGPTQDELDSAQAAVTQAQAQLATAEDNLATLQAGPTEAELASAEAAVLQAQNQLDLKLHPSTDADIQVAQASVEQAKASLQTAQNDLANATLLAPFDGAVSAVNGAVGENVSGTVVTLLDLSAPQLQVTIPETDVAKIQVGQQAMITFEALDGQMLPGKVLSINPQATVQSGVATYAARIEIQSAPQLSQGGSGQGPAAAGKTGQGQA